MKKIFLQLVFIFFLSFFTSCEREEFEISNETPQNQSDYQVKKISFSELKRNQNAFEKLKESRSKISPSYLQRGVFNEDFGVFIDTTNILITEKDGKHSITFRIINDEELSKVENLVLNSKDDGSYKAFITEYLLSQEELIKLANNEDIGDKKPSAITDLSSYARFSITGNGADCVSMLNYTVGYCENANGQIIVDRGNNGGPVGTTCVGGWFEVEYVIMVIDDGCLSGGGGGGGNDSGGDNSGYNPGGGNWSGGGGSPTDGNPGNPNTGNPDTGGGNSGNDPNPNPDLTDGNGNPIITTPILTIDKREVKLYNLLNTTQQTWWNNAPQETKNVMLEYFNQNSPDSIVNEEALAFVEELINSALEGTLISSKPFFKYPPNSNYATLYPNFTSILQDIIPYGFENDEVLIDIIHDLTSVSKEQIKEDLKWGFGAEIHIVQLGSTPETGNIKGMFNPIQPDKIFIDVDLVNLYENSYNPNDQLSTLPLQALIIYSVLLHELVHYLDYQFDQIMINNIELGLYFESLYNGGYYEFNPNGDGSIIFKKD